MGKHKNTVQDKILLSFMERHKEIATGFVKGDKVATEQLWTELAEELNSHGPPSKDVQGWKKVWIDWKGIVRKKIAHNNSEGRATGGGPFNKYVLTAAEEAIGQLCGIFKVVRGIDNTVEVGQPCANEQCVSSEEVGASYIATTSATDDATTAAATTAAATSKRRREPSRQREEFIKKYVVEQTQAIKNVDEHLKKRNDENKENLRLMKDIKGHIKDVSHNLKKVSEIFKNFAEENKRSNLKMEELRKEELYLKRKELELEADKFNFKKGNAD